MLLESVGIHPDIESSSIDESHRPDETPEDYVRRMAREKAEFAAKTHLHDDVCILAADTIVVLDDEILGKPIDTNHAFETLEKLSSHVHTVMTSVCMFRTRDKKSETILTKTHVHFTSLSENKIREYIDTGEPMDKAGAYGIQGRAAAFVKAIEGSYTGVVGLPLCETLELIDKFGD